MALRLIEIVLKENESEGVLRLPQENRIMQYKRIHLQNGEVLLRILLDLAFTKGISAILIVVMVAVALLPP